MNWPFMIGFFAPLVVIGLGYLFYHMYQAYKDNRDEKKVVSTTGSRWGADVTDELVEMGAEPIPGGKYYLRTDDPYARYNIKLYAVIDEETVRSDDINPSSPYAEELLRAAREARRSLMYLANIRSNKIALQNLAEKKMTVIGDKQPWKSDN